MLLLLGSVEMAVATKKMVGIFHAGNRLRAKNANDVHEHVMKAIVNQRLLPGTKLSEDTLSECFGLGRRMIDAALARLEWEGLVTRQRNRGAYVAIPTAAEAHEIFQARQAIEARVVEAIAKTPSEAAIKVLDDNIRKARACQEGSSLREAVILSGKFHVLVAEHAGNRYLAQQVRLLVARTSLVSELFGNPGGLKCWHDEHEEICECIRKQKPKMAATLMTKHLHAIESGLKLDRKARLSFDIRDVFRAHS
jgi:DNA-binding GntR family transcriptional regulator